MFPGSPFYVILACVALVDAIWLLTTDVDLAPQSFFPVIFPVILLGAVVVGIRKLQSWMAKKLPDGGGRDMAYIDRIRTFLEAFFFIRASWLCLSIYNYLLMSIPGTPYADDLLARADAALKLDWKTYFLLATSRPWSIFILKAAYYALPPVSMAGFLYLFLGGRTSRARFYIAGYFITAFICITIGMLFPANGAVWRMIPDEETTKRFGEAFWGSYNVPILRMLRDQRPALIELVNIRGLVTFPSFHTASGIVLSWTFWRTRLFWPVTAYTAVMIASTPVIGSHYMVDLLGGTVIAVAVLAFLSRRPACRPLFSGSGEDPRDQTIP